MSLPGMEAWLWTDMNQMLQEPIPDCVVIYWHSGTLHRSSAWWQHCSGFMMVTTGEKAQQSNTSPVGCINRRPKDADVVTQPAHTLASNNDIS